MHLLLAQFVVNATCGDYNGAESGTLVFTDAMCGLGKVYDTTKASTSISGNSESAAATACCKVSFNAPVHLYAHQFYLRSHFCVALAHENEKAQHTFVAHICMRTLRAQFATNTTCGDYDPAAGTAVPFTTAMCGAGKEYDSTKASTAIAGNAESAAVTKCCKVCISVHKHI